MERLATLKNPLRHLQKRLEEEYRLYRSGDISEKEYLKRARPIDQAIEKLEMATLWEILVTTRSSSPPSVKQRS